MLRVYPLVATAALLSACSGSGGDGDHDPVVGRGSEAICQVIGDGSPVTSTAVQPSNFEDDVLVFDGHLDSWATLSPATSASGTISAGGVPRSAGDRPGVAFTTPSNGVVSVTISTYMGDTPRETMQVGTQAYGNAGSQNCNGDCLNNSQSGMSFFGMATLMDFDRIEAAIQVSGLDEPLQLRELCVR
jgi:hypothetical protein